MQAVSITGALRLGGTFLSRHPAHPPVKAIYIPNPTTEEEAWALKDSGLDIRLYRFLDRKTGGVDWEGMREDLQVRDRVCAVEMWLIVNCLRRAPRPSLWC